MEDLGVPRELETESLRCKERAQYIFSTQLESSPNGNLLAASSRYGYFFIASEKKILTHLLETIRRVDEEAETIPPTIVDLSTYKIDSILAIYLVHNDDLLLVHTKSTNLLLSIPFLAKGQLPPNPPTVPPSLSISTGNQLVAATHANTVSIHQVPSSSTTTSIQISDALCTAISIDDKFIAISSSNGTILINSTKDGSNLTTIEQVEDGWIPYSVHFLDNYSLMASYANEEMTSHVVWHLKADNDNTLIVKTHSPLGEICWALPVTEEEESNRQDYPLVLCARIPEWDCCFITSSWSTDVECLRKDKEDGVWTIWKFEERFTPVVPTTDDYVNTYPFGIVTDFTDTKPIPASDPSNPEIKPMPRLLLLTTGQQVVPFAVVDESPGAECKQVAKPTPLPDMASVPEELKNGIQESKQDSSADEQEIDITKRNAGLPPTMAGSAFSFPTFKPPSTTTAKTSIFHFDTQQKNQIDPPTMTTFADNPLSKLSISSNQDTNVKNIFSSSTTTPLSSNKPEPTKASLKPSQRMLENPRKTTPAFSFSKSEKSAVNTVPQDSLFGTFGSQPITKPTFEKLATTSTFGPGSAFQSHQKTIPPSKFGFTNTEKFLSNFEISTTNKPTTQETQKWRRQSGSEESSSGEADDEINAAVSESGSSRPKSSIKPTPTVTLEPSLNEATSALASGDGREIIQSILLEMQEELQITREASRLIIQDLSSNDETVNKDIVSVRRSLQHILNIIKEGYKTENGIRDKVSTQLSEILLLSRDYEAATLELQVQQSESHSAGLKREDRAQDQEILRKEREVLKMMASIEDNLESEEHTVKSAPNTSETIHQIYSSLSLQGIRIKRVMTALKELAQRVELQSVGDRSADLGLSLARLEKLSIGSNKSEGKKSLKKDADTLSQLMSKPNMVDDSQLVSPDVRTMLRTLAMRNGRQNIMTSKSDREDFTEDGYSKGTETAEHTSVYSEPSREEEPVVTSFAKRPLQKMKEQTDTKPLTFGINMNNITSSSVVQSFSEPKDPPSIPFNVVKPQSQPKPTPPIITAATTTTSTPFSFASSSASKITTASTFTATTMQAATKASTLPSKSASPSPVIPPLPSSLNFTTSSFKPFSTSVSTHPTKPSDTKPSFTDVAAKKTPQFAAPPPDDDDDDDKPSAEPKQAMNKKPPPFASLPPEEEEEEEEEEKEENERKKMHTSFVTNTTTSNEGVATTSVPLFGSAASSKPQTNSTFSLGAADKPQQNNLFAALPPEDDDNPTSTKNDTTQLSSEPPKQTTITSNTTSLGALPSDPAPARKLSFGTSSTSQPSFFTNNPTTTSFGSPFGSTSNAFASPFPTAAMTASSSAFLSTISSEQTNSVTSKPFTNTRDKTDGSSTESDNDSGQAMMDSMEASNEFGTNTNSNINPFATNQTQQSTNTTNLFAQSTNNLFANTTTTNSTSNTIFGTNTSQNPFGTTNTPPQSQPFAQPTSQPSFSSFGQPSAAFGSSSPLGALGNNNNNDTNNNAFGTPKFGESTTFGQSASFGNTTPIGAFGGSSAGPPPFSNFANTTSNTTNNASPFASFNTNSASPFGNNSSNTSGFASLANSAGAFGNGTANLTFGNTTAPPEFKAAAAFNQRRK